MNKTTETIREAKVEDNVDPNETGKIQVRILPEMLDFSTADLPWATPYRLGTGISADNGIHEVPEVGSFVRVLIEDWPYLKRIRFISDDYVEGLYIYSKFADTVSIDELSTQTYPQPFFKCYKDGTIAFHNSETSEHGVFFKGGGYFLQDSTGNFFLNTKTKGIKAYNDEGAIELKADGKIELNGNTKQFVTWTELNTVLSTLQTSLNSHTHLVASLGSPTGPASASTPPITFSLDISAAKTTTILTSG